MAFAPIKHAAEMVPQQVALMFLTRGDMPHEASWRAWLRTAEGLVPVEAASAALCRPQQPHCHTPAPNLLPHIAQVGASAGVLCLQASSIHMLPYARTLPWLAWLPMHAWPCRQAVDWAPAQTMQLICSMHMPRELAPAPVFPKDERDCGCSRRRQA